VEHVNHSNITTDEIMMAMNLILNDLNIFQPIATTHNLPKGLATPMDLGWSLKGLPPVSTGIQDVLVTSWDPLKMDLGVVHSLILVVCVFSLVWFYQVYFQHRDALNFAVKVLQVIPRPNAELP
jgi:hypothetical protein